MILLPFDVLSSIELLKFWRSNKPIMVIIDVLKSRKSFEGVSARVELVVYL